MDSRVGLDYIVETPEYISKLAAVLDTPGNTPVKKQVFELLSALCVYNEDGYRRTIDTLECYRQLKGDRTGSGYLDVFDEQRESDDQQQSVVNGLDLNSPLDVFYAVLRQVQDTPQETTFLSILQHLLRIDTKDPVGGMAWDTAERLVHRVTLLENRDEAARLSPLANIDRLPQQETPVPKIRMKTINWNKIPSNKVIGRNNIWSLVADEHQNSPMADMDWTEMEGLFCQQTTAPGTCATTSRHAREPSATASGTTRMRKENAEVTLLDGKRSLNVNIFLKQFRSSNEDIIQLVTQGEHDEIGAEKLRGLLKILPEVDELDMLKSYNGDFAKLGNAEKFLLQLTALSNYKLRIESMLLKEEFASNMGYLEPSIQAMIAAADGLMTNKALQEVLYMVLVTGNFLNSGGYAGNAAGVKLTSLQKITDIRANKPNMNLIHYVAQQAEKRNKQLLIFPDNLTVLEDASKTTVEQLQNEIKTLDSRIKKIKKIIEMPNTESEIKTQMIDFLLMAERDVSGLQHSMRALERTRTRLAEFFCEDSATFKLEECFRVFHGFCVRFRQAVSENARRRLQEEQANARRKQREEIMAARRKQMCGSGGAGSSGAGTPVSDSDGPFLDIMFLDRRKQHRNNHPQMNGGTSEDDMSSMPPSPCVTRRRIGSFNGAQYQQQSDNNAATAGRVDERSPDITPNGSLRRRRSRVLSEEDEGNLMDFLRTSGHDNTNRERKSWGSLDRSWARRARGNGPRKRPALLSADFSIDRERPNSPSSLLENKPILAEEQELVEQQQPTNSNTTTTTSRPREWRQKIESWLRDNESEHSPNTSRRQVTLTNRRSLEMDSENERNQTLDTVHEGKPVAQQVHRRPQSEWKPSTTIDTANVLGTLEAVEDVQQQPQPSPVKDKSAWRKSTLNVPNSTEEITENEVNSRQQRQAVTRHTGDTSSSGRTMDHERKGIISGLGDRAASDRLTLYMRRPTTNSTVEATPMISNKVEIDSDNIETPPATRKVFSPTPVDKREPTPPTQCRRMLGHVPGLSTSTEEQDTPADGQFDRFSSARRTRRYKRQSEQSTVVGADTASTATVVKSEIVRPNQLQLLQPSCPTVNNTMQDKQQGGGSPLLEKDARLKHWQERLRSATNSTDTSPVKSRGSRQLTGINGDDVRAALRLARLTAAAPTSDIVPANNKTTKDQHDNDEGFEESQSLMSESLSQATSASGGCAYETDTLDTSLKIRPVRTSSTESKCTVTSTASSESATPDPVVVPIRTQRQSGEESVQRRSVIPRRSSTIRKTDTQTSVSLSKASISECNTTTKDSTTETCTIRISEQQSTPASARHGLHETDNFQYNEEPYNRNTQQWHCGSTVLIIQNHNTV
ncbi:formin 3 [Carabus blaptoides fortunei]